MSTNVGEPLLLASYALPSWTGKKKQGSDFFEGFSTVYASHSQFAGSGDGQVSVAVQRDGVHILDLSDLHPVQSHTLGPSTLFACPPLTIVSSSAGKLTRRTYAAIHSSQGVGHDNQGKVLWCWSSPVSEDSGAQLDKQTTSLQHSIASFVKADRNAVCISRNCYISVIGEELQVLSHWHPTENHILVKAFAFPSAKCTLSPSASIQHGSLVFVFARDASNLLLRLHVLTINQKGEISLVDSRECPIKDSELVTDVSCDPSGHLSFIGRDGFWTHIRAEIRDSRLFLFATERIRVKGFLFPTNPEIQQQPIPCPTPALLALRSSYVLLAGVTSSHSRVVALLLWDVQFGVLLNSHMLPIPSTLEDLQSSSLAVSLVQGSNSQALLVLSPFVSTHQSLPSTSKGQLHSSVLVIPYTCPPVSTIVSALVRSSEGSRWLVEVAQTPPILNLAPDDDAILEIIDEPREKLLVAMQEAMEEENPKKADNLFFEWHRGAANRAADKAMESLHQWTSPWKREVNMNDAFIRRLLEVTLQPNNIANKKYSTKVLRFLLEKRNIAHGLVEGGLLPVLLRYSDWGAIFFVLKRMNDIPEVVLMQLLNVVVKNHLQTQSNDDVMDTQDAPANPSRCPTLDVFLAACINYPASSIATRTAIREHFKDAEEVLCVLQVLEGWLEYWFEKGILLVLEDKKKAKKRKKGNAETGDEMIDAEPLEGDMNTPQLSNILFYLQAIFDSSFISLLQHPQSHSHLRRILALISPQIDYNESLELLRGTLEPFAKRAAVAADDWEARESPGVGKSGKKVTKAEARRRLREQREVDELRIGAYQVEEVFL